MNLGERQVMIGLRGSKNPLELFFPATRRIESPGEESTDLHPARLQPSSTGANITSWPFFVNLFLFFLKSF